MATKEVNSIPKLSSETTLTEAKAWLIWMGGSPYHGHVHGDTQSPDVEARLVRNMAIAKAVLKGRYDNVFDVEKVAIKIIDNVSNARRVLEYVTDVDVDSGDVSPDVENVIEDYFNDIVGLNKKNG